MPKETRYTPDPRFPALGAEFADPVDPAPFPSCVLRWRNQRWASAVGLGGLSEDSFASHFHAFSPLPDNISKPLAMRYHGHQFRSYNPDIGDGRGFMFAQLRDDDGRLLDLATKGSGKTPYSRTADGRLTLKGAVREILAAHMLEALGVYTSKAFAVFETGEALTRYDEPSPTRSAVLTRLGHSHIRIGTFQRLAYLGRSDLTAQLVDHCAEVYYPELLALEGKARALALLERVSTANARLAASWLAAGFVHGVLNTDNMNVTGESFDYGPWRFLPVCDQSFTAAYFDETGLYAFGRQPHAAAWNMAQLGGALMLVSDEAALTAALAGFGEAYRGALRDAVFRRLGLAPNDLDADLGFVSLLFDWLVTSRTPFEGFFFDWFCGDARRAMERPRAAFYADPEFANVRAEIAKHAPVRPERLGHAYFARQSPPTLLIEDVEALWAAIAASDDWSAFDAKIAEIDAAREAFDF
jgi:uncharacterized protein YdiU (UPF0061 family)